MNISQALFYKNNHLLTSINLIIPTTLESKIKGLSDYVSLPIDTGMLFTDLNNDHFWMKNTRMSLDLIFIKDNIIVDIKRGSKFSLLSIYSEYEYDKVIEVNMGYCKYFNIKPGDFVLFI